MSALLWDRRSEWRSQAAGAAFGDLDNDGRIDVVIWNIDGRPMVLHNDATSSTRWITLELIGARSNRLAISAKLKAAVGSLVQIDEVRSGGSYLSHSDLRIHFGLDNADKVDRVEIRWPSGQAEVLQNLPANRFYVIKEEEGITPPERARPALKKAAQKTCQGTHESGDLDIQSPSARRY